ncbi:unnamed protein product, partial [Symbiodinium natans]
MGHTSHSGHSGKAVREFAARMIGVLAALLLVGVIAIITTVDAQILTLPRPLGAPPPTVCVTMRNDSKGSKFLLHVK